MSCEILRSIGIAVGYTLLSVKLKFQHLTYFFACKTSKDLAFNQ